ncbi:MAG: hypothetical protein RLZZ15_2934, partial [Verrucomicrobiota bacterium]
MNSRLPQLLSATLLAAFLALSACAKKAEAPATAPKSVAAGAAGAAAPLAVEVVKESERSRSFLAVNKHLELGGSLYGFVDVEGDVLKQVVGLREILGRVAAVQPDVAPYANQDYGALATTLGLTDVKAIGVSSVPVGGEFFRNRIFFYTGGERHGLLAGLGGKPAPFKHVALAPADAAFFAESELDLPVIYKTIRAVVAKVAGEPAGNQMETAIKKAGEDIALSVLDLIYGLKGRSAIVLRLDASKPLRLPGPPPALTLPGISLLVCIEGIAPVVETALAKSPALRRTDADGLRVFELKEALPLDGLKPVLVVDGSTFYLATTRAFYDECRAAKPAGLAQAPEFRAALARVGPEGNGLTYVSPRVSTALGDFMKLNPEFSPQFQPLLDMLGGQVPAMAEPLISVRTNLPDGVLVSSHWNRTLKQEVMLGSLASPVTIGLVAAMAIPAFQKVRASSQEKAVLNNLRMLAAAADQFYL